MRKNEYKKELLDLGLLPTKEQELLLKAALLKGEEAIKAWHEWKTCVDIEFIDHGSNRLLPLLYFNLVKNDINDPIINRYKGTLRKTWYKNQLLISELKTLLTIFQQAGIKTIVLKGMALILKYYPNYGLRPMNDIDVMVPVNQIPEALLVLEKEGWISKSQIIFESKEYKKFTRKKIDKQYFSVYASVNFVNNLKKDFDLHGHILHQNTKDDADNIFWETAHAYKINNDLNTHILCPTYFLFQVIIHGLRKENITNIRWIADSYTIIANSQIDWDRLSVMADVQGLNIYLIYGISYLKELLNIPVPEDWFKELQNIHLSPKEYRYFRMENKGNSKFFLYLSLWFRHSRLHRNTNFFKRVLLFPEFIKKIFLFTNYLQIPFFIFYMILTRKLSKIFRS